MPKHAYHCAIARAEHSNTNWWSIREKTAAVAMTLLAMQHARSIVAGSPPGTAAGYLMA